MKGVVLVLFQPEDVVNVAGAVRAMSNFGLKDLRLVEPAAFDAYRVEGIAHHAGEIIERVRRYPTLEAAVADCSLVLGTTGRPRRVRRERLTPREAAPIVLRVAAAHPGAPVAVLFGRERDGLPNSALDLCHAVVTIPTSPENHSLNLAQAVLVIAYELCGSPRAAEAKLLSHLFRHIARVARTAYAARRAAGEEPPGPDATRPEPGGRGADPAGPTS